MPVPEVYTKGSAPLTLYNFLDIVQAIGILELYGGKTQSTNILSNSTFASQGSGTFFSGGSVGDWTEAVNMNFDATINRPLIMGGNGLCQVPITGRNGNAGSTHYARAKITVQKISGSITETVVSQTTSTAVQSISTSANEFYHPVMAVFLNFTQTTFKKGDTLRVNVLIEYNTSGGGTFYTVLRHDPADRVNDAVLKQTSSNAIPDSSDTTQLKIQLPIKIDT